MFRDGESSAKGKVKNPTMLLSAVACSRDRQPGC